MEEVEFAVAEVIFSGTRSVLQRGRKSPRAPRVLNCGSSRKIHREKGEKTIPMMEPMRRVKMVRLWHMQLMLLLVSQGGGTA